MRDIAQLPGGGWDEIAAFLIGKFGKEANLCCGDQDIAHGCLPHRPGGTDRFELGEGLGFGLDEIGPGLQRAKTVAGGRCRPTRGAQRLFCRLDRLIDDGGIRPGDACQAAAIGGSCHRNLCRRRDIGFSDVVPCGQGQCAGIK